MFQKDGTASNSKNAKKQDVPLRKSEKRKLRERIYDTFPHLFTSPSSAFDDEEDDDDDDDVKPSNDAEESYKQNEVLLDGMLAFGGGGDLIVRKLRLPNIPTMMLYLRTPNGSNGNLRKNKTNYRNDESVCGWPYRSTTQPIILDMEVENRKMMLIPCLAFLSMFPSALPQIVVPSQVSKYLCRGADLMKSGVLGLNNNTRETEVYRGDVVSIAVRGNPQPFGIGFMTGDAAPMEVGVGTKGVAVKMITCYGDDLYRIQLPVRNANGSGSSRRNMDDDDVDVVDYDNGNFGNVGFIDGALVRPVLQNKEMDSTDEEEEEDEGSDNTQDGEDQTLNITDSPSEAVDNITKDMANTAITNDDPPPTTEEEEEDNEPDALLLYTFYKALNTTVKDTLLPMPVSIFYGGHLLPARPKNTTLEIKQTTYKKIGTFLQNQANEGIISLSPSSDGKDKTAFLTAVHRSHPHLRLAKKEFNKESPSSSSTTAADTADSKRKVAIVNLVCVPSQIATTLNLPRDAVSASNAKSEARQNTGFLTGSECRAILLDYVRTNDLIDPMDPSMVILDGPICDALFKPTKKEIKAGITVNYPIACTRKEIQERWTKKMEKAYAVVAMPGNRVLSIQRGTPSEVLIEVEKRQGNNKYITRVRGLEEYGINGALFAKDVAKRFACASTVETNPEGRAALKKGNVELVFQGHLLEELKALLTGDTNLSSHGGSKGGEYCIPKGVIVENLRGKVVKKKKK